MMYTPNIEVHQKKIDWDEATGWEIFDPWLCLFEKSKHFEYSQEKEYIITVPSDTLTEEGNYEINME